MLKPFTPNNYGVKESFDFTKDITQKRSKLFTACLDVDSLFTNVPLDETIELCVNELFKSDQKYYSQIDGVAMCYPLGTTLAKIFLCYRKTMWLKNCPKSFKPVYYKR